MPHDRAPKIPPRPVLGACRHCMVARLCGDGAVGRAMSYFPRVTFHKDGFLPPDAVSASVRGNWAGGASALPALFSLAVLARATA